MGLDSVELICEIEHRFDIQIPDLECEQIATVQQISNAVFDKIKLSSQKDIVQVVLVQLKSAFKKLFSKDINIDTRLINVFSKQYLKEHWDLLEQELNLKLPKLINLDFKEVPTEYVTFLGFNIFKRRCEPIDKSTIKELIGWIVSLNFEELLDIKKISNKYEVERIVCGIMDYQCGVPVREIKLHYHIVYDLGID